MFNSTQRESFGRSHLPIPQQHGNVQARKKRNSNKMKSPNTWDSARPQFFMALQAFNCHNYTILLFKAGQTDGITAPWQQMVV
jgi:hypothetical protein